MGRFGFGFRKIKKKEKGEDFENNKEKVSLSPAPETRKNRNKHRCCSLPAAKSESIQRDTPLCGKGFFTIKPTHIRHNILQGGKEGHKSGCKEQKRKMRGD
ncbi:hypothetical protein AGMMS50296_2720 [Alphaproteobacteria bacterium]|nr:hypothetical protein AGMMS50296_2720 [Alphaproteobacteria bacterium]